MNDEKIKQDKIIQWLVRWAENQENVRAMILTSSRTNPYASIDLFSDYDVILVVREILPFYEDKSYLGDYGKVLVVYKNPMGEEGGFAHSADITQYEDGTKIDYSFSPVEWLRWVVEQPELPEDLENGCIVLLDKDRLADGLKPPAYSAYIPVPPEERVYQDLIQEFFHESTYVAKQLWRDDLIPMKYNLDFVMKFHLLRQMLEWRMEIDHGWSVKTGAYGKGLKKRLPPEIWSELEATYAGAGTAENWEALYRTIAFFRKVAIQVGDRLGYEYPDELQLRVLNYLGRVENLDQDAQTFSSFS